MARILTNSQGKVIVASDNAFEVTAAVDPNITAGNIKEGVEILGVTGTFAQNAEAEENDVIFIDYDGTIRYSYSAQDFLALTEMPANPTHPGLVSQGWNWTLAEAKTYVSANGELVVGQHYVTDDGTTRMYINVGSELRQRTIRWYQSNADGVTVDWGDDSALETYGTAGASQLTHTYASGGDYVIRMKCVTGTYKLGDGSGNTSVFGNAQSESTNNERSSVYKVELGPGAEFNYYAFRDCPNLAFITTPSGFREVASQACYNNGLIAFVLGKNDSAGSSSVGSMAFNACPLRYISFPNNVSYYGTFNGCSKLRRATLSGPATSLDTYAFVTNARRLILPSTLTTIGSGSLYSIKVEKLIVPATVTSIGNQSMAGMANLRKLYMLPTTPPSLYSSGALSDNADLVIYVPYSSDHSILTAYKEASNWSYYAERMVEMPE